MGYRKLITPEFRVTLPEFILKDGIEVECFSSRSAKCDWCKVTLTTQYKNIISYADNDPAMVELGYGGDFDTLISGYTRYGNNDYWKEIIIKDDMMQLERIEIKAVFTTCNPQDVIRYILVQAGVKNYQLTETQYEAKEAIIVNRQSGIQALKEINSTWGIENDFFFRDGIFYWGCRPEQDIVYVLEEDNNILSFQRYGNLWEIETIGIPWIHHSQRIEIKHSKFTGMVTVEKTIIKSDSDGKVRMYIYFKGG